MRLRLLSSVALSGVITCLVSFKDWGECVEAPNCTDLGYTLTASDCPKGYVKCPWNTGLVYCECSDDYKYTCTGSNETAGTNKCGSKYTACGCASGYKWESGSCKCGDEYKYTCTNANETAGTNKCGNKYKDCGCQSGYTWENGSCVQEKCKIGDIYYTDNSYSSDLVAGKTVLGIVVHITDGGKHGQIMAPWPINKDGNKVSGYTGVGWGYDYLAERNISDLPDYGTASEAQKDYDSCGNTDKIVAYGEAYEFPAAWATQKYAPTRATKSQWCLPAAGILVNINNNLDAIKTAISKVGGVSLLQGNNIYYWSSSEGGAEYAWSCRFDSRYLDSRPLDYEFKKSYHAIVPVLEF